MATVFLSLGSSLGNKEETVKSAIADFKNIGEVLATSSFYYTQPEGGVAKNVFLNCAVKIETALSPQELLKKCQAIEEKHGRTRNQKWADRTLDIDIITYDDLVIDEPNLKIPHPLAKERGFVQKPIREITEY